MAADLAADLAVEALVADLAVSQTRAPHAGQSAEADGGRRACAGQQGAQHYWLVGERQDEEDAGAHQGWERMPSSVHHCRDACSGGD